MSKNIKLSNLKTNTNDYDNGRKKLSNNPNPKIYNNIYLSPNKNLNYQLTQTKEDRNSYQPTPNFNSINTEESKNEVRSNSYNKMKPSIINAIKLI